MLLVRGLGTQMIQWPESFVETLARERNVILFDNRDVGKSQKFADSGVPDLASLMSGADVPVPYLLKDMAADAVGVLDAFDIERAHVFGRSMGGMIVQEMAATSASGSRVAKWTQTKTPNLVIHGADDPLVKLEGGRDTARHISAAALEVVEGMGHDLPHSLVPRIVNLVLRHTASATAAA